MKHHLVSVIMPCHNGERYIELSVRSVLAQTYQNWELLVIDDASTDASVDIVQAICQEDARVKLLINDNPLGLPYAPRNFGTISHSWTAMTCGRSRILKIFLKYLKATVVWLLLFRGIA